MPDDAERVTLTYDQAAALLPEGEQVHTFVDSGLALLGADWDREQVLALLRSGSPELSGSMATSMGHGLVAFRPTGDPVFIATDEAALAALVSHA